MPLWLVFHTPDAFVDNESKQAFAKDVTSLYTAIGLPAFYVIVNFFPMSQGMCWKGGEMPEKPFVRMAIEHIAVRLDPDIDTYRRTTAKVESIIKPHVADKGYDYEYHIDETERELWRINGFIPPPWHSEAEKTWFRLNKPVPFETDEQGK
ncbi:hypothetical protein BDV12DRAFT_207751 [Aspergillus spectabilis]